jgi:hypothetical protein
MYIDVHGRALLPLSAAQLEVWFAYQLSPDDPSYNIGGWVELRGHLDENTFREAVRLTVEEVDICHNFDLTNRAQQNLFRPFRAGHCVDAFQGLKPLAESLGPFGT